MSGPTLKLPSGADEWLRDFPVSEPDFEAQAKTIEARLHARLDGSADDVLKAPELTPEPGEPAKAPVRSFTEMARQSVQQPTHDDSTALVKELLAATSQARRPDADMVARVRAAGKSPATTPLPSGERPSGVVARAAAAPAAPVAAEAPTNRRGVMLGTLGAALAVAAAIALFVRSGASDAPPPLEDRSATSAAEVVPLAPPRTEDVPAKPSPGVLGSPDALATSAEPTANETTGATPKTATAPGAASLASKAQPAGAIATKPGKVVLQDDPQTEKTAGAERQAEPPPEPAMKPAEGSTDNVPLSPSGGAVSTALGAVRGGAQACLAGQSSSVTAVVTFASDGHVTSVTAGGPSGACIQAALSKARLTPFARDHFSATTTIRPP